MHAWRLGTAPDWRTAVRTCDCGSKQLVNKDELKDAPKGYEAIWDAPWAEAK